MPLSDDDWAALARALRRAAARHAPGWTGSNTHDPGITILELLAYALEDLAVRNDRLSSDARAIARKVAERAGAIAARDSGDTDAAPSLGRAGGALVRPRFVAGQLLTADDLTAEQDYVRDRIDRRNRLLCGAGIVDGLAVTVDDGADGLHVVVQPGLAFDRFGREIFVGCAARAALPAAGTTLVVCVAYRESAERLAPAPVATLGDDDGQGASQTDRIVEIFELSLAVAPADDALPIARLRRSRGRWRPDPRFRPARVRR
jgi:hypothetical protein